VLVVSSTPLMLVPSTNTWTSLHFLRVDGLSPWRGANSTLLLNVEITRTYGGPFSPMFSSNTPGFGTKPVKVWNFNQGAGSPGVGTGPLITFSTWTLLAPRSSWRSSKNSLEV